jgi:hypothetical protein
MTNGTRRLFGIDDLLTSEARVAAHTDDLLDDIVRNYRGLIDVLLNLPYFWGKPEDAETTEGSFRAYARGHYLQAPYTLWTISRIWRSGHYLEANILLRYVLEIVVQLRFFQRYPEELANQFMPGRGVRFLKMFDEFAPGYYREYYGNVFSALAHGKTGPFIFRYERQETGSHRIRMGCEYDHDSATMVMNHVLVLIFSFFNLFPLYFPDNTLTSDSEMAADVSDAVRWLEGVMRVHKEGFPDSLPWYRHMDKIVRAS